MRLPLNLLVVSFSIVTVFPAVAGETSPAKSQSQQSYTVRCRWIKQQDEQLVFPELRVSDGRKGSISDVRHSPFVIGVSRASEPKKDKSVGRQPHIVVLEDGIKIDLIVAGRQPDGATVDVTIEEPKIGKVETKRINSDTTIQIPSVEIRKKRVIDFVKFGEAFVIPLGEKPSNGRMACLEIVIVDGEDTRQN